MPEKDEALLSVNIATDKYWERPERLSRSPHPYHRYGASFSHSNESYETSAIALMEATPLPDNDHETTYFDADHRKRRKGRECSSESGTEADDEKEHILLGLPAPPAKPRKGLKDSTQIASPLLTPSYLDDYRHKAALEARTTRRTSLQGQNTDDETAKLRQKFTRQKKAELVRRIIETVLLLAVGFITMHPHFVTWWDSITKEMTPSDPSSFNYALNANPLAVISYITIVLGLYTLYPLRIMIQNHSLNAARQRSRFYVHIPAAFDPAPLLYPVLLPVVVAWLIAPGDPQALLPNLILGIASIPSKIVPLGNLAWFSSPQWLLSILSLVPTSLRISRGGLVTSTQLSKSNDIENLLLIYPLHQALLPLLQHLTTTSLLPAELQLLSASMINLFVLSSSPQALILKALLWIGGVLVLVLCNTILRLGVTLARIPSWRFRRLGCRSHQRLPFLSAIDNIFNGQLSRWGVTSQDSDSCESESDIPQMTRGRSPNHELLKIKTSALTVAPELRLLHQVSATPMSATGKGKASETPRHNDTIVESLPARKRLRRNTLPSCTKFSEDTSLQHDLKFAGSQMLQRSKFWSFRSLTSFQATGLRWLFAIYVYIAVIAIVVFPIRLYVQESALHGREPFGWALGYLFGDVPFFKSFVEDWGLGSWINLPSGTGEYVGLSRPAAIATIPFSWFGAGNTRLLICIYCLAIIAIGLMVVFHLSAIVEVDTRRKVFHGMMVAMFLPTVFIDPIFMSLALILVLAVFLILDLFRASQLPPISKPLTYFLAPYVDGRDHRGPVIVSHIFLLIGCAIPLWLSLAAQPRGGEAPWEGWEVGKRDLGMIAGVVCVGMGDAAASLIGRRYGRRRWCWSGGKSLEGSLAFAMAVVFGLSAARLWLLAAGWEGDSGDSSAVFLVKAAVAASGASLTEAVLTGGNDNVIVPVILWLLVRGLQM